MRRRVVFLGTFKRNWRRAGELFHNTSSRNDIELASVIFSSVRQGTNFLIDIDDSRGNRLGSRGYY